MKKVHPQQWSHGFVGFSIPLAVWKLHILWILWSENAGPSESWIGSRYTKMKVLVLGLRLVTFSPREWDDWDFFWGESCGGFSQQIWEKNRKYKGCDWLHPENGGISGRGDSFWKLGFSASMLFFGGCKIPNWWRFWGELFLRASRLFLCKADIAFWWLQVATCLKVSKQSWRCKSSKIGCSQELLFYPYVLVFTSWQISCVVLVFAARHATLLEKHW